MLFKRIYEVLKNISTTLFQFFSFNKQKFVLKSNNVSIHFHKNLLFIDFLHFLYFTKLAKYLTIIYFYVKKMDISFPFTASILLSGFFNVEIISKSFLFLKLNKLTCRKTAATTKCLYWY